MELRPLRTKREYQAALKQAEALIHGYSSAFVIA